MIKINKGVVIMAGKEEEILTDFGIIAQIILKTYPTQDVYDAIEVALQEMKGEE